MRLSEATRQSSARPWCASKAPNFSGADTFSASDWHARSAGIMKLSAGSSDSGRRRRRYARRQEQENAPSYKVTIREEPAFLHAIVTGTNSKENVVRYLEDVQRECIARGYARVLIEEHLKGPRLDTLSVFQIAARGSISIEHAFEAIAYVDANASGDLMDFAETVAVNRDLPLAVFRSIQEARDWLLSRDEAASLQVQEYDSRPGRTRTS
jgi:hypothetical protein